MNQRKNNPTKFRTNLNLYINNSSVDIMVEGVEQFSFSEEVTMKIKQKDSYVISFDELGGKESASLEHIHYQALQKNVRL